MTCGKEDNDDHVDNQDEDDNEMMKILIVAGGLFVASDIVVYVYLECKKDIRIKPYQLHSKNILMITMLQGMIEDVTAIKMIVISLIKHANINGVACVTTYLYTSIKPK